MRLGIADHFGWAVAVVASDDCAVVERQRIELVEPGITPAPIHYDSARLGPDATAALVAEVRASIARAAARAFDDLAASVGTPIVSISLRSLPRDFPADIATLCRPPWEARADAVMYRTVLVELAQQRGWDVCFYEAKHVVRQASDLLGDRADDILNGPRARLGPPWTADHRTALAATVVAAYAG